jgi:DNA-binding transcriptional MerR regulator
MNDTQTASKIDDPVIAIGVLAEKAGLSASAVRKYEKEGLIIARRTVSGHRLFSHRDVSRVRNIQHMIQDLGLNIEGIRRMQALLPCWDLHRCGTATCESCPARKEGARPCWMVKGVACAAGRDQCRTCVVYRLGSLRTEDLKRLLYGQTASRGGRRS